jgi:addiction module HigA family antidote
MATKKIQTPGSMLKTLLAKHGIKPSTLAKELKISDALVYLIKEDKSKITVPVAFKLAKHFNTNPEYWLAAQMKFDISKAEKNTVLQKSLKNISKISKSPKK